jgi:5-methylcytosine-specific restriction protein B
MQTDLFMYWANQQAEADLQSAATVTAISTEDNGLAEPFSRIFANHKEAQWTFDFLRDALERLGVSDPDDPRFALTLRHNHKTLRLNYGMWAVLQFYGNGSALERVGIAFLEDQVSLPTEIPRWEPFSDERSIRVYELPIAMARKIPAQLQAAYETTFAYLAKRFGDWSACPFRRFNQSEIAVAVFTPAERAELLTTGLQPEQIELVDDMEEPQSGRGYFSARTFDMLQALHAEPQRAFYLEHKEAFKVHLKEPFQRLMHDVAARLPAAITATMETERNVFARILKNDFGQGGAWDFYWGAFYPQGGKRIADPQLSMWINHELLEFGFYIGDYGNASRQRFQRNSQEHYEVLVELLESQLSDPSLFFGPHEDIVIAEDGTVSSKTGMNWADWLRDPERGAFDASVVLPRTKVLRYSAEDLVSEIMATYQRLFPLVLLAMEDDPLPTILDYLDLPIVQDSEDAVTLQPEYPLVTCAEDTGFDVVEMANWVRAIERKKQAIFYGPPGTGKTYMAEHLARHLVGGGNGFFDIVQFHPAYAYEDFIQGLRPQARDDGGLDYPLVPGRFLEFCTQAEKRRDPCVLIIDEINRANLARVFGELMYLLEYRDREIPLAGGKRFRIPKNIRIIGTMNTADRSIALVDHALRRRFAFLALYPNYEVLRRYHQRTSFQVEGLIGKLQELNQHIGDFHYQVGITFFLRDDLAETLPDIWQMEIEPYLEEYFFDQSGNVDKFRWININIDHQVLP